MNIPKQTKSAGKRYYRKRVELFRLIEKIKLWPSRRGLLHGIKSIEKTGDQAWITTHCRKLSWSAIRETAVRPGG